MKKLLSRRTLILLLAALAVYVSVDLFYPFTTDLRSFDPNELGRLDMEMWRSYYDKKPVKMFFQLAKVLRTQYEFPVLRSFVGAYHAGKAAFIFKDGRERSDYEQALPNLRKYFHAIHAIGNIDFDIEQATRLELEWWIVHRQRERYPEEELGSACANAAAEVYRIEPESALEHGRLRATAMTIRDTKAKLGGVTEADWREIERLLKQCYTSLHASVASHVQPVTRLQQ
ncbi:MAG: hypothetical protein HY961_12675 [Ignavibacteriae bacterium]|nr:hypothetical protein [Ignavibacteriota bacterium]